MPLSKDEIKMGFVATCIEELAATLNKDYEEVFDLLDSLGLIDNYIVKHYDTLHCESRKHLVEDLLETIEIRKQKITKDSE